jgi:hypothetical protein
MDNDDLVFEGPSPDLQSWIWEVLRVCDVLAVARQDHRKGALLYTLPAHRLLTSPGGHYK